IAVAPLRRRADDIPTLVRHFASQFGPHSATFAHETLVEMQRRPWHGNVRELKNAVDHALTVARTGAVLPMHLPEPLPPLDAPAASPAGPPVLRQAVSALASSLLENPQNAGGVYDRFLEQVEPPLLAAVLKCNGNRCAPAARALGLHRTTLKRKLDQYGIDEAPGG
ncbi:MAG TPA: helix-turn-helix domain-containing protein, partial [Lacipirellulaceae bacterium]|nr:helix-turn-helix domain-containing protein [Lacipirellulaceae bacterium]